MNNFTKKDIKNGAVIELRNGKRFLKVDNTLFGLMNNVLNEKNDSYLLLSYYDENLRYKPAAEYDIMKVLNPTTIFSINGDNCISALLTLNYAKVSWTWERKEKRMKKVKLKDMTFEQYKNWKLKNCMKVSCKDCKFNKVECWEEAVGCWIKNKDLYNEKFLNQEIEIEEE